MEIVSGQLTTNVGLALYSSGKEIQGVELRQSSVLAGEDGGAKGTTGPCTPAAAFSNLQTFFCNVLSFPEWGRQWHRYNGPRELSRNPDPSLQRAWWGELCHAPSRLQANNVSWVHVVSLTLDPQGSMWSQDHRAWGSTAKTCYSHFGPLCTVSE